MTINYDPELPFVVRVRFSEELLGRFSDLQDAEQITASIYGGYDTEVIDTTPKPKIPEDAEFILVESEDVGKDIYQRVEDKHEDAGFYWYRAIDSMAYGHEEMPEMIGDAEVTVLVRKEDS